ESNDQAGERNLQESSGIDEHQDGEKAGQEAVPGEHQLLPIEALASPELAEQALSNEGERARPEHGHVENVHEDVVAIQLEEWDQVPEEPEVGNAGEEQDRGGGSGRQGQRHERTGSAEG